MVLRDGFDVDAVSNGWSIDIDQPFVPPSTPLETNGADEEVLDSAASTNGHAENSQRDPDGSAVALYESQVQHSSLDALHLAQQKQDTTKLEVEAASAQDFLATLVPRIEAERKVDEEQGRQFVQDAQGPDEVISEHIGPVQFNMGGIQVDADDMVQRLKVNFSIFDSSQSFFDQPS